MTRVPADAASTDAASAAAGSGPTGRRVLAAEERLVRAAAEGDNHAFGQLYDAHARYLYGYAVRRLGDPSRAEDVVQEVFLALVRRGAEYRGLAPLRAYLFRIAHHRISNLWRDARPQGAAVERSVAPHYEEVLAVRDAIGRLPASFREPLELTVYGGLSYDEVAEVLGCPIGTVRSRIARAKGRLVKVLGSTLERRRTR